MEAATSPTPEIVLDAMHDVIDPELGYNIVDIGLIYECHVNDGVVQIIMTMTTPGCPAQDYIMLGVQERGMRIPGVKDTNVELIWHPPWSVQMMTPVAKAHFRIPEDSA
ncbi:MAG TPA: metal-sulfur cluster assembly factor [Gammaproteobacteria bacterium]|nr:metal-sulfur cluster assembly factor [Gammaproteobacteria bacterium]